VAHANEIEDRSEEMAKGTFGERLKRERELREVTVDEIASATRIAPKFLEALENEQWDKLPGGVFGRGFVRSIARYLGLSEENLLSEYDLARGETALPAEQKPEQRIPSPPKWLPAAATVILIALIVGLVLGGRYAWRLYMAHRAAKKASAVVSIPSVPVTQELLPSGRPNSATDTHEEAAPLDLSVAASSPMHVRVVADGAVDYDAELPAGQNLHFSANEEFDVTAADSSALLLWLNGQTVASSGVPGSSSTISLTSKNLRQATGGTTQH
jgi:cytoskeleton protein RodZ